MAQSLVLVNPRRRRRRSAHRRRRNPSTGQFMGSATNPRRRHHHRRRNPANPYMPKHRSFFELGKRRRRNPDGPTEGVDVVDIGVGAAAFWLTNAIAGFYQNATATPNAWVTIGVKGLAALGLGYAADMLLGRGPSAVFGGGLNAGMSLIDQVAPQVGQQPPFPGVGTSNPPLQLGSGSSSTTTTTSSSSTGGL